LVSATRRYRVTVLTSLRRRLLLVSADPTLPRDGTDLVTAQIAVGQRDPTLPRAVLTSLQRRLLLVSATRRYRVTVLISLQRGLSVDQLDPTLPRVGTDLVTAQIDVGSTDPTLPRDGPDPVSETVFQID
jgi:hypothetical protein